MDDGDRKPADRDPDKAEKPLGRDERVSGHPLSFEDVVRAMHRTPRAADKKKPPPKEASK